MSERVAGEPTALSGPDPLAREPARVERGSWTTQSVALQVLCVVLLAASLFSPTTMVPTTSIDGSFCAALNELHLRGARAGAEWIYTWGPLGWIQSSAFDEHLWIARFVLGDVLLNVGISVLLVRLLWRAPVFERALALAALFLLDVHGDTKLVLAAWAAYEIVLDRLDSRAWTAATAAFLLVLGLMKFSLLLLAVPLCFLVVLARGRQVSARAGLSTAGTCVLTLALLWLLAGQNLLDLPAWFAWSLRISAGYSSAMATEAPEALLDLGLFVLALSVARLVLAFARRARPADGPVRAAGFVLLLVLAFKHGYVRGSDHTPFFFATAAIAALLFRRAEDGGRWPACALGLRLATVLVCFAGALGSRTQPLPLTGMLSTRSIAVENAWLAARGPSVLAEWGERERETARLAWSLPATRAHVGNDSIDLFPTEIGVLLLGGWNWTPRPVFQSYLTLDAELQEWNARFMRGADAPRWVLLALAGLDRRLPTMEDASALRVLARDYVPIDGEQGFLLLRRRDDAPRAAHEEVVVERTLRFGEPLDLSALGPGMHSVSAELRPSLYGRAQNLFLRLPQPFLEIRTRKGAVHRSSIVPAMLRTGAIVDPVLVRKEHWLTLFDEHGRERPAELVFRAPEGHEHAFEADIEVRILCEPLPEACDVSAARRGIHAPVLELAPFEQTLPRPGGIRRVEAGTVLLCHAPSRMRFRLPAGDHVVRGVCGVLPGADGTSWPGVIGFRAFLVRPGISAEPRFLLKLEAGTNAAHRVAQPFELEYSAPDGAELVLRTVSSASDGQPIEGAYWGNLTVD